MTSDRRFVLTEKAERDFRSILRYTPQARGVRQRDVYADRLISAMGDFIKFPVLGAARDDISPGLRFHPVEHHVNYNRFNDDHVVVVRILHERMDVFTHVES